jgi:hypothetical protein
VPRPGETRLETAMPATAGHAGPGRSGPDPRTASPCASGRDRPGIPPRHDKEVPR